MKLPFRSSGDPVPEAGEMTLVEHLVELRKRVMRSLLAIGVAGIAVYILRNRIFKILSAPYCEFQAELDRECEFLASGPLVGFSFVLTLVGYGALLLALPVVLYQMARFIMPGLHPHEKRAVAPFLIVSVLLLLGGIVAAYVVMPRALDALNNFGFDEFVPFFEPTEYIGFLLKMLFAFGIAAELPLVLVFLQMVGVVQPATLAGNRRIAVAAIVLLAAIVTPTGDPFNLAIIAIPMYLFYEIAIVIGKQMARRSAKKASRAGATSSTGS